MDNVNITTTSPGGNVITQHYDCSTLTDRVHQLEGEILDLRTELRQVQAVTSKLTDELRHFVEDVPFIQPVGNFHVNE